MKMTEQFPLTGISLKIEQAHHMHRLLCKQSQANARVIIARMHSKGIPGMEPLSEQVVSVEKHRGAIYRALTRRIESITAEGRLAFTMHFNTEDSDLNGNLGDESGSYFHRALFARTLLHEHGITNADFHDKGNFAILVVVL